MKKRIILSFDYELFFGIKSGTVQKTLINPTNMLLDCMDSVGAKGNFFVDYLMFERMEQLDDERAKLDLEKLKLQIKDIVRRGHRIELHLHPHWIDAVYNDNGTWSYSNYEHYSLYALSKKEIERQFRKGVEYLTKLAREVDPYYKIVAFRAGGWAIQPFDIIKDCFKKNGIIIDSSVMHGMCQDNKYSKFDFSKSPNKELYRFSSDVCIEDENGEFVEVPITMLKKPFWLRIIDKIVKIFLDKKLFTCSTDGSHIRYDLPKQENPKIGFWTSRYVCASISSRTPIVAFINQIITPYRLITYIDHPKDYMPSALSVIKLCSSNTESITYKELIGNLKRK